MINIINNKGFMEYVSKENIEQIHQAGLDILYKYGIKVQDPEVRKLMEEYSCKVEGERVKIPREIIEKVLKNLKKKITFIGADGKLIIIQPGVTATHATGGAPFCLDPYTGEKKDATLKDLIDSIHVMNQLDQLDIPCAYVWPSDLPNKISQLRQCETMFKYSNKPVYGLGVSSPDEAKYITEIFKACTDKSVTDSYRGLVGVSPESPLYIPKYISDTLKTLIQGSVPVSILSAPIAGMSSPITIAGSIAQMHAETLAMTVLAYIYNPNTPVLYGSRVCFADMRSGISTWGVPEIGMASSIAAQLAKYAGFMSDLYGLASASCTFDAQIGYEKSINALMPVLNGAELISGFGSMASVMLGSLTQLAIDNEIFAMIKQVAKGVDINSDTLAIEVMGKVLNGGSYISAKHTIKNLRGKTMFTPELGFTNGYGSWCKTGSKDIAARAAVKVAGFMKDERCEVLDSTTSKELDKIIESASKKLL